MDDIVIEVHTILESRREPDYLCFKVETDDDEVYDFRNHEYENSWQVRESLKRR